MSSTNLTINGHHLEVTPAIREYVIKKIERDLKHTATATATIVNHSVAPLKRRAENTDRVPGKELFCEALEDDLYAAIDVLADKADRMVLKHKTKKTDTARRAV